MNSEDDFTPEELITENKSRELLEGENERLQERVNQLEVQKKQLEERNRLLEELSIVDELTELGNRRKFITELEKARSAVKRGKQMTLAVIDVDRFRDVNNNLGHLVGDRALIAIAEALRTSLRGTDEGFRYGGDEMTAIIEGTEEEAKIAAERIRQTVTDVVRVAIPEMDWDQTISIGVTAIKLDDIDGKQIIRRADQATYKAKEEKNKVVIWTPEMRNIKVENRSL